MDVTLLPSSLSRPGQPASRAQYLSSYLINDSVAIDAGSLGLWGLPEDQQRIHHVFLTHAHSDHVATLPVFIENAFRADSPCVCIHASDHVLTTLRQNLFNDSTWPDLERISADYPDTPILRLKPLEPYRSVEAAGLKITPIPVNHSVPTLAFLVEGPDASIVFSADTGPTSDLWTASASAPNLKAVFLEASFPNALAWLADRSLHLTPSLFASELAKLRPLRPDFLQIRFLAVHIKPKYAHRISQELLALGLPNIEICEPGHTYHFAP